MSPYRFNSDINVALLVIDIVSTQPRRGDLILELDNKDFETPKE